MIIMMIGTVVGSSFEVKVVRSGRNWKEKKSYDEERKICFHV